MRRKGGKRKRDRFTKFQAGAIGIILIVLVAYGAVTKFANPFANKFTIHAVVANANGVLPQSLVRIAGVNVGRVTQVAPAPGCAQNAQAKCQAATISMEIQDVGLPIHNDATVAIRPRIFLEGNFFIDIRPGTPSAPVVKSGHIFPVQQSVEPVQLDQVLTSLQADTRANLQILLKQYGSALDESGSSFNSSIQYWLPAYKYSAIVTHDLLGTQPHDLSNYIDKGGTVAAALDAHPVNLKSLITDFNTTANAFAVQNRNLAAAVGELPRTLAAATPALNALNNAFPPVRALASALLPGVRTAIPTINASLPFISQLRKLVQPAELRGLTSDLSVTVPALARLTNRTIPLMKNQVRPAASCVRNVIYPWSQLTLNDGTLSGTKGMPLRPVYVEAVDYLPGLAGESRDFDPNGPYIRVLGNGGSLTYSLQPGLFGQSLAPLSAVQPRLPPGGNRPPLMENVPCETQPAITNLYAPPSAPLQQLHTNVAAPAAAARWKSVADVALSSLKALTKQQGIGLSLSSKLKSLLAGK